MRYLEYPSEDIWRRNGYIKFCKQGNRRKTIYADLMDEYGEAIEALANDFNRCKTAHGISIEDSWVEEGKRKRKGDGRIFRVG